jgi:uncharacterized protein YdaU (DUF1376 family)
MNYYEHHIGDYAKATSHLTFVEDAAYSRLIRKYYDTEMPLPADLSSVQRLVGARTREEKIAVKTVLEEFFFLDTDGWHNKRADEEIEWYHSKSAKARDSANVRWMREQEKRNATAMRTHSDGNALQSPVTSHQTPVKEKEGQIPKAEPKPARAARGTQIPHDFALTESLIKYADMKNVDHKVEFENFVNWHTAKGTVMKNWDAAWRTWCNKSAEFQRLRVAQAIGGGAYANKMTHQQATKLAAARTIFGDERSLANEQRIIDITPPQIAG